MKTILSLLLLSLFFFNVKKEVKSYKIITPTCESRGCSGSAYCSACKNCSGCKYCAKEGGTCGVCNPTPKKKATLKKVKK